MRLPGLIGYHSVPIMKDKRGWNLGIHSYFKRMLCNNEKKYKVLNVIEFSIVSTLPLHWGGGGGAR